MESLLEVFAEKEVPCPVLWFWKSFRKFLGSVADYAVRPPDLRKHRFGLSACFRTVFESPPPSEKPYRRHRFFPLPQEAETVEYASRSTTALPFRVASRTRSSPSQRKSPSKRERPCRAFYSFFFLFCKIDF